MLICVCMLWRLYVVAVCRGCMCRLYVTTICVNCVQWLKCHSIKPCLNHFDSTLYIQMVSWLSQQNNQASYHLTNNVYMISSNEPLLKYHLYNAVCGGCVC